MTARGWLKRNRWGVVALPVVGVLAVGANSYRLQDYWWDRDLRSATVADGADFVSYTQDYDDSIGATSRTFQVRVGEIAPTETIDSEVGDVLGEEPVVVPAGARALAVRLDFEAEPDQALYGCQLALEDVDGNRYVFDSTQEGIDQDPFPCLPFETPGPRVPFFEGQTREVVAGEERPATWSTEPVLVVPEDAEISRVLLWWETPDYLALRVPGQPDA
ncbi:MAG: hypothetical protein WBQ50_11825 [Nocardioides sp.]